VRDRALDSATHGMVRAKVRGHDASNNGDSKLIEALDSDEID